MSRQSRCEAGFTLIEMVVVLAILGMMVGLIVSRGPMRSERLDVDAAAREVAGSLRLARARAIAGDRTVTWVAGPGGFTSDNGVLHRLPPGITLDGSARIGFAGDGSSSGGQILLRSGDRAVAIGVNWLTGGVQLADRH